MVWTQSKLDDALKELEVGRVRDLPSLLDLYVLCRHFVYHPHNLSKHFPSPSPLPQHLLMLWLQPQQRTANSQMPSFVMQVLQMFLVDMGETELEDGMRDGYWV